MKYILPLFESHDLEDGDEGWENIFEGISGVVFGEIELTTVHGHAQEGVDQDENEDQQKDVDELVYRPWDDIEDVE